VGARVLLVEATSTIGGTTSFSGGQVWIPNNHLMLERGMSDSREEALDYLRAVSPNRRSPNDEARWAAFVDHAPT
jgi:3-oxosteroid 1-dehydrogenase